MTTCGQYQDKEDEERLDRFSKITREKNSSLNLKE